MILNVSSIRREYEAAQGKRVQNYRVNRIMRDLLDLRYTKLVPIPVQGNSERCRVQRQ